MDLQNKILTSALFIFPLVLAVFAIGFAIFSPVEIQVSDNETYLYNLGYSNGWNAGIATHPVSKEPSVTQSELISQIAEALGTADKIDLKIHGDKLTGKASLSLNIEFTEPSEGEE